MADEIIQAHDFDDEYKQIKKYADEVLPKLQFDSFKESEGLFDLFSHKVTGEEMNQFEKKLQGYLVSFNERDKTFFELLRRVYKFWEKYDKDIIQALLISVKSAENASAQALKAQKDADTTIKALEKIVKKLQEFKEQIDTYQHLSDVDNIWKENGRLSRELSEAKKKSGESTRKINQKISKLNEFQNNLTKSKHLYDIDQIWESANATKKKVEKYKKDFDIFLEKTNKEIKVLKDFQQVLTKYEHLKEVDTTWQEVQTLTENYKSIADVQSGLSESIALVSDDLSKLGDDLQGIAQRLDERCETIENSVTEIQSRVDGVVSTQSNNMEIIDNKIIEEKGNRIRTDDKLFEKLTLTEKKLRVSYFVGGGALVLTVIQFILNIIGVV